MLSAQYPEPYMHPVSLKLRITKLLVQRSGTYNQMYYRPYQTHFDADVAEDLQRRLDNQGAAGKTTSTLMAGLANRIIMPAQQHAGAIPIVNQWNTPRGRFMMVVEAQAASGSMFKYYIQGYTSHFDISFSGEPDPQMLFFVNSYSKVSSDYAHTPTGLVQFDRITESAQVINGRLTVSQVSGSELYGMRPNEIYGIMQNEMLRSEHIPYDLRTGLRDDRHVFSNVTVPSARGNNLPSNMLAKIVDSYQVGQQTENYGSGYEDVFTRAKVQVYEGTIQENPFFRLLSNIRGQPETSTFKLSDLMQIDPNVNSPQVTTFVTLNSQGMSKLNSAGQSEYWHRPDDTQAWVCSVLVNSVSSIMMEMMLTRLVFSAHNHDSMGLNQIQFNFVRDILGRDNHQSLEVFKARFVREIMHDLTYGNQELYQLNMQVDLMGDTVIDIAYGRNPMTRYVVPTFCDSLMAPILSPNENILMNTAHDFSRILSNVHGVTRPSTISTAI